MTMKGQNALMALRGLHGLAAAEQSRRRRLTDEAVPLDLHVDTAVVDAACARRVTPQRAAARPPLQGVELLDDAGPRRVVPALDERVHQHLRRLPGQEPEPRRGVTRLIGGQLLLVHLYH